MAHAFRNGDEVTNGAPRRRGPAGHEHRPLEDIKTMVGIGMIVQRAASRNLEIIHARLRRRNHRPKMTPSSTIAQEIIAMHNGRDSFALTCDFRRRLLRDRVGWLLPVGLLSSFSGDKD